MNRNNAIAILLALLVLALLGSGAAGYMYFSHELSLQSYRADAAEMHSREMDKQVAELTETARIAEERGREISTLRNQAAEYEKQLAELKSKPTFNTMTLQGGVPGNINWAWHAPDQFAQPQVVQPGAVFLGAGDGQVQNVQVEEITRRLNLDLNEQQVQQEVVKFIDGGLQLQNVQLTPPQLVLGGGIPALPAEHAPAAVAPAPPVGAPPAAAIQVTPPPTVETTRRTRLTRRLVEPEKTPDLAEPTRLTARPVELQKARTAQEPRVQVQIDRLIDEPKPTPVKPPKKDDPTTEQF